MDSEAHCPLKGLFKYLRVSVFIEFMTRIFCVDRGILKLIF